MYEINADGTIIRNARTKRPLKIVLDCHHYSKGYYATFIHMGGRRPDAKTVRVMLHRAVAECWLDSYQECGQVEHIDKNPHNNSYRNLKCIA